MSPRSSQGEARVAVIGRANIDLTVQVPHPTTVGRTVFGSALVASPGGKAFNQAVAMATLGGRADLIANVGADMWGEQIRRALVDAGVGIDGLRMLPDVATGAAIIEVTPDGESYILLAVSPQTELTDIDVERALRHHQASTVVTQLDLQPNAIDGLFRTPRPDLLIGNLIPHPDLDRKVLAQLDVYVVNQHEAAVVLGVDHLEPATAAEALRQLGPRIAVVTAGSDGAAYSYESGTETVPAPKVDVVDTSGAGDAFLAGLTVSLAHGNSLSQATAFGVQTGSLAVQRRGSLLSQSGGLPIV